MAVGNAALNEAAVGHEDSGRLQFVERTGKGAHYAIYVGGVMRGGEKAREALLNIDSARAQMMIQQAREAFFVGEVEIEEAPVTLDPAAQATPFEFEVEAPDEFGGRLG